MYKNNEMSVKLNCKEYRLVKIIFLKDSNVRVNALTDLMNPKFYLWGVQ